MKPSKDKENIAPKLPPIMRRAKAIADALGTTPIENLDCIAQEAYRMVRIAMHDPKFSPCGDVAIRWLKGKGLLFAPQLVGIEDHRTFNFILQMAPDERERFIAEGEQKLLQSGMVEAIEVKAEEVEEAK